MKDPILDELHATRERILDESGGTLAALVKKLEQDQVASGRELRNARRKMGSTQADGPPQTIGCPIQSAG